MAFPLFAPHFQDRTPHTPLHPWDPPDATRVEAKGALRRLRGLDLILMVRWGWGAEAESSVPIHGGAFTVSSPPDTQQQPQSRVHNHSGNWGPMPPPGSPRKYFLTFKGHRYPVPSDVPVPEVFKNVDVRDRCVAQCAGYTWGFMV